MALGNFVPQLWANELLVNMQKALVYGNVVNRDYEGEIKAYGDTVKINSIGDITVGDYIKGTTNVSPEQLTGAQKTLLINQAKYFAFEVDDVDKAQQNPKVMAGAMQQAGYNLADVADKYIASLYTGVAAGNTIGDDAAPIVPTATDAYDYLVDLAVKLDEANVPVSDRYVVVPAFFHGLLLKDQRFVSGSGLAEDVRSKGAIGEAAGLTVFKSNNVPNTAGTKYKVIAGHPSAISFAGQIASVEPYRPEGSFSDAVKGLHLYGGALIRPEAIAVLTINKN